MRNLLAALLIAAAGSTLANAQAFEAGGFGGYLRATNKDLGSGFALDPKWLFGFRMNINAWDRYGYEIGYAYHRVGITSPPAGAGQPASQLAGTAGHTVTAGLLAHATHEGARLRPYATGGGGFTNFIPPGGSISRTGGDRKFGFYFGGGVKYLLMEDRPWMLRFDVRQHYTGKPFDLPGANGLLGRTEVTIGVSYAL